VTDHRLTIQGEAEDRVRADARGRAEVQDIITEKKKTAA
jgi:hypothetical protein